MPKKLETLLLPLIKEATFIEVLPASKPLENAHLLSHFGGRPYFEKGEEWPKSKSGSHLDFVFQIFNETGLALPQEIKLIQFFYDWEEFPWDTKDDGWLVKVYKNLNKNQIQSINRTSDLNMETYCQVKFQPVQSLPDWDGIDIYTDKISDLAEFSNTDEPWEVYDKAVEKLIGNQDYRSQLGGYPRWIQGESTPLNERGEQMKLLFQIDSEDNADIMWGDSGLIYVFYDSDSNKLEFKLQCC